ncbi:TonB-linked SusC/RagA family outer membrane protein [Breznakibacter xylanolyticus]|uniref:TonB-linked SusC/RagA family outer membrane protein n=2 Tax=Breznakibacter xylanolyticus TaxID=990 RepID=A0A2W7PVU2_9BACT|nr:TonB-linked SusC/RagA family outer membrane protein [Breznakibacter xylanolyticus]
MYEVMIKDQNANRGTSVRTFSRAALLFVCMMCLSVFPALAQNIQIKGKVVETGTNEPIPGVNIVVEGTTNGVITDFDGNYQISAPSNATLVFSFIGFIPQKQAVQGRNAINVTLASDTKQLDEVVAIGYGTAKKKDLTGSVSSVSGEVLQKMPVANAAQAMTGRLAGVQITSADGSPDAEMIIRVRGGGSVTGDNSPLYIVDGFPVKSINDIDQSNIETIDVLKDASSTAIYGSQGANGVIIITTKKAKEGRTEVNYNGYVQTKKMARKVDVLSPYEFALFNYELNAIAGSSDLIKFEKAFGVYEDLDLYKYIDGKDWQEDMFGNEVMSYSHNLNVSGGTEKTKFNLGATYNNDEGLMKTDGYNRLNLNFKINHDIAKNLKLDFSARISDTNVDGSGSSGGSYKVRTYEAVSKAPVDGLLGMVKVNPSMFDTEEEYEQYLTSTMSLSDKAAQYWKRKETNTYNFTGGVTWKMLKGLTYRLEGGYEYGFIDTKNYWGPQTSVSSNEGQNLPLVDWDKTTVGRYRVANTLNYDKTFADIHKVNVLVGQEATSSSSDYNYMKVKFFSETMSPEKIFANIALNSGATGAMTTSSYVSPDDNLSSFFGRANYTFMDKYLLTLTFRADGSSKFAEGNQWGYFPAASVAWRIKEESFMAGFDFISNLKLRASYGTAGNNRIASSLYKLDYKIYNAKTYGVGETTNAYYAPTNTILANPNLKWETTITRNAGLDFGFFDERISGNLDAYWNSTEDLLITSPVVAPGYTHQQLNVGKTSNKGIELALNAYIIEKKNFSLSANFNIAFNRSQVDELADGIVEQEYNSGWASTDLTGADDYRVIVGQPIGLIYGFVTDGYYKTTDFSDYNGTKYVVKTGEDGKPVAPKSSVASGSIGVRPGAVKFKDLDGNGVIDLNDRQIIGRTAPKHTGGFGLNGTFYGFDASVMFNWVYGNDIYNANKIASSQKYRTTNPNLLGFMSQDNRYSYIDESGNVLTSLEDLAQYNEGANAKEYWSPLSFGNANVVPHSWAIEDGSFLRLQNITLGYSIPKSLLSKVYIQNFRMYASVNNIYCWTNYSGYDPEVSTPVRSSSTSGLTPGVDYSSYPKSLSWTFGVNVTF